MDRVAALVVGLLLALGVAARAEKTNPVEKLAADAAGAYRAGEFQRAATLLERAYKLQPLSALLYNLAKAYEKLGDEEKAADLYGRYAAADDADPRLKSKAEAKVASLHVEQRRNGEAPPPRNAEPPPRNVEPPRVDTHPAPAPAVVTAPVLKEDPTVTRRRDAERQRLRDRNVAIGLGAVGVAFLGSAVGLSVHALTLHDQFASSPVEADKRSYMSQAQTQALVADVLFAGGAVAVGVGAFFLYRALRPLPKALALAPYASPLGGGLVAGGKF